VTSKNRSCKSFILGSNFQCGSCYTHTHTYTHIRNCSENSWGLGR